MPSEWIESHFGYPKSTDTVQLFNLNEDIAQKNNLAHRLPERVKQMQGELELVQKQEIFIE